MTDFDDTMRRALRSGHKIEIGADEIGSARGLVTEIFRFRSRLIAVSSVVKIALLWLLAVGSGVMTFVADDERGRFLFGFVSLASLIGLSLLWQFHWMLLNRNAVLRELKRLELQIAERDALRDHGDA